MSPFVIIGESNCFIKISKVKIVATSSNQVLYIAFIVISLLACCTVYAQTTIPSTPLESMRISLYQVNVNGTLTLADGNLTNYDDIYSNGLEDDAPKMNNFGENFGISRESTKLAIELRQKINIYDTAFFSMWNMQQRNYRLLINTNNLEHPGLLGFLEDKFLNSSTSLALNGINTYDFSVNSVAGSYDQDRFRITFRNPSLIPLSSTFTGFTGKLNVNKIDLQWNTTNEVSVHEYVLERSLDRIHYGKISRMSAINTPGIKSYNSVDVSYFKGDNYYRVKSVGMNGEITYSPILKISAGSLNHEILVFPNPVVDKKMTLVISGQKAEKYHISLYNNTGNLIPLPSVEISSGASSHTIQLPQSLPAGVYRVRINSAENGTTIKTINVL